MDNDGDEDFETGTQLSYTLYQTVDYKARPMTENEYYLVQGNEEIPLELEDGVITVPAGTYTYNAQGQAPTIKVVNPANKAKLTADDYTDATADTEAVNADDYEAAFTAVADGNYTGEITVKWTIDQADISEYITVAPKNNNAGMFIHC